MISFFRRYLTSLPVLILFGLILVAFAVTGINDPFGGGAPAGSIAKVGERTITENQLLQAFDRAARQIRERNPTATQADLARDGGVEQIATQLIGQTAMEELGRTAGIVASERLIGAELAAIPAFQTGGKFDEAAYRRVLAEQQLNDKELRTSIAGDLLRRQMIQPITGALSVPDGVAAAYARLLVDEHKGSIALVPSAATAAPTEAEIAAWYAANKARFTVPERRGFRYARIDSGAIGAKVVISDKQIADAFAADTAKYGAVPTRRLEQVVVPDEAKAKAVAAAAASEGFAAAAQRLAGFGAADIDLGEQNQAAFGKATSAEVAAAAFALPVGGVSAPVKSRFGWHVVRVAALGGSGKTLAQVRGQVLADLKARATQDAIADVVNSIEDGVEAGKSFADIAAEASLTIATQTPVTREGSVPGGPPADPAFVVLAERAFAHEPADGPVVDDLGGGELVVVETTQVIPAAPQPLATVKAAATAATAQDKALKAARARADAIVAAVKKGTKFADAVAAQGLPAPRPIAGRRMDVVPGQPVPPLVQIFLSTPPGTVKVVASGQGWVLINAESVIPGDVKAVPGLLEGSRREVASQLPEEMATAFANAAVKAVGVNRNAATIAAVRRRLSGQDAQ
jgi:peptidyl-prolyl cis-trans isomerase D